MAGHNGRKNLVLHASNYIIHLYPTVQKAPSILIVIAAYSNSVTTYERVLASTFSLPTPNNYEASCLAFCLNLLEVQAVTKLYQNSPHLLSKLHASFLNLLTELLHLLVGGLDLLLVKLRNSLV